MRDPCCHVPFTSLKMKTVPVLKPFWSETRSWSFLKGNYLKFTVKMLKLSDTTWCWDRATCVQMYPVQIAVDCMLWAMSSKAFRFVCNAFEFQWRAPSVVLIHNPSVRHSKAELLDKHWLCNVRLQAAFPSKLHMQYEEYCTYIPFTILDWRSNPTVSIHLICCF